MHDWQDEVLRFPEDIVPPAFMWRSEASGEESGLGSRSSVIRSHYEEIRKYLEEKGYADLALMSDRLETRQSRLEERLSTLESRLLYLKAQQTAFYDCYAEIESAFGSSGSKTSESLRKTPIGDAMLDEDLALELSTNSAWKLDMGSDDGSDNALNSMRIAYHPSDDKVNPDLQALRTDFDSADLYPSDKFVFTGDRTWGEVFDRFEIRIESLRERRGKLRKTRELLDFRYAMAETVLFQFEAFGKTVEMTEEKARRLGADDEDRAVGTPETWKKNAAMMHAYFCNHGAPEHLSDVDKVIEEEGLLDSFSHDHTWRILKKKGWASSSGSIQALVEALERWATDFEDKYGRRKADLLADPFNWPSPND